MELRHRDVGLSVLVAFIAWGYATSWMPSIRFIPYAFLYGIAAAGLVSLFLAITITLPVPLRGQGRAPSKRLALSSPDLWQDEIDQLDIRGRYRPTRLTSDSSELSTELDTFLRTIISSFVESWYSKISPNPTFTNEVDKILRVVLAGVFKKLGSQDLVGLIVRKILPLVTDHIHEFDIAERAVKGKRLNRQVTESAELDSAIAARYHDGALHSAISVTNSASKSGEQEHLRRLSSRLLVAFLPANVQGSTAVVSLVREIVCCAVLHPIISSLSEPDTWNKIVEGYSRKVLEERNTIRRIRDTLDEHTLSQSLLRDADVAMVTFPNFLPQDNERKFERFIRTIRKCNNLSDARRFRSEVASQLRKESSSEGHDTLYLRRLEIGKHMLDQRIAQLGMGTIRKPLRTKYRPLVGSKLSLRSARPSNEMGGLGHQSGRGSPSMGASSAPGPKSQLETSSLEEVLNNASGLSGFMEYMDRLGLMSLVQFWLVVNGFRNPLETAGLNIHGVSVSAWTATDRGDLAQIKEGYLGRHEVNAPPELIRTINVFLKEGNSATPSQYQDARKAIFTVQSSVYTRMERDYFPRFKKSDLWFKLLASDEAASRSVTRRHGSMSIPDSGSREEPSSRMRPSSLSLESWAPADDEDMASSVYSMDSDVGKSPWLGEPIENTKAVNAMQATLNNIIQESRGVHRLKDDFKENDPSHTAKPKSQLASLGLINTSTTSEISMFDELFEDEDKHRRRTEVLDESDAESVEDEIHEAVPGDLGLAEAIDGLTLEIEKVIAQEAIVASMINKAELTNKATELRLLRKSKTSLEREIHHKELQRQQYILQESDNGLYGRSSISIDSVVTGHEPDGKEYAMYIVQVEREAGEFMPAAVWVVPRRYSEFHALHKRLQSRYPAVMQLEFPRRQMVLKLQLQKDLLEKRRVGLQKYLRELLKMPAVCRSQEFRAFLSQAAVPGAKLRKSKGLFPPDSVEARDIISRIYSSVSDGVEGLIGNIPVLDQISTAGQNFISAATQRPNSGLGLTSPSLRSGTPFFTYGGGGSSSNNLDIPTTASSSSSSRRDTEAPAGTFTAMLDPETAAEAEAELHAFDNKEQKQVPLVDPISRIFLELFELNRESNWLRGRAVVVVLQQLLGGTVERKVRSIFRNAIMPESLAGYVRGVRMMLWPGAGAGASGKIDEGVLLSPGPSSTVSPSSSLPSNSHSTATISPPNPSSPNRPAPNTQPPSPSPNTQQPQPPRTEGQKMKTKRDASLMLAMVLPDMVGSVVGRANAVQAARRIVTVVNNRTLNAHLVFTVLDELSKALVDE